MIVLVSFSKSPGSFGSANTDPILKNVVIMRNIISQLKISDGGPSQTYVIGDLETTADSSLGSEKDLSLIEPVTVGAILILASSRRIRVRDRSGGGARCDGCSHLSRPGNNVSAQSESTVGPQSSEESQI